MLRTAEIVSASNDRVSRRGKSGSHRFSRPCAARDPPRRVCCPPSRSPLWPPRPVSSSCRRPPFRFRRRRRLRPRRPSDATGKGGHGRQRNATCRRGTSARFTDGRVLYVARDGVSQNERVNETPEWKKKRINDVSRVPRPLCVTAFTPYGNQRQNVRPAIIIIIIGAADTRAPS